MQGCQDFGISLALHVRSIHQAARPLMDWFVRSVGVTCDAVLLPDGWVAKESSCKIGWSRHASAICWCHCRCGLLLSTKLLLLSLPIFVIFLTRSAAMRTSAGLFVMTICSNFRSQLPFFQHRSCTDEEVGSLSGSDQWTYSTSNDPHLSFNQT